MPALRLIFSVLMIVTMLGIRDKFSNVKRERIKFILPPSPDSWNKNIALFCHIFITFPVLTLQWMENTCAWTVSSNFIKTCILKRNHKLDKLKHNFVSFVFLNKQPNIYFKKYSKTLCYLKKVRKGNDHRASDLRLYDPYSPYGLREWLVVETVFIDITALEGVAIHFF